MIRIENIRPILKPGNWSIESSKLVLDSDTLKSPLTLPFEANVFIKLFKGTYSISEIILKILNDSSHFRYAVFTETLLTLCEKDLFVNNNEIYDSLREILFSEESKGQSSSKRAQVIEKSFFTPERLKSFIAKTSIYTASNPKITEQVINNSQLKYISESEKIINQGSEGLEAFILLAGAVGVYKKNVEGKSEFITKLEPISLFGESSVILNKKRTADVVALEDSWVLSIDMHKLVDLSTKADYQNLDSLKTRILTNQVLLTAPIFKGLPYDVMQLFLSKSENKHCIRGIEVIGQGQTALDDQALFYFILDGSVSVVKDEKHICNLEPGDYFGEVSALKTKKRTAKVVTNVDSTFLTLSPAALNLVLANNLSLALQMEKLADMRLSNRLKSTEDQQKNTADAFDEITFTKSTSIEDIQSLSLEMAQTGSFVIKKGDEE